MLFSVCFPTQPTRCFRLKTPNTSHRSSKCTGGNRQQEVIEVGEVILVIGVFVQGVSLTKSCRVRRNISSLSCPEHLYSTSCTFTHICRGRFIVKVSVFTFGVFLCTIQGINPHDQLDWTKKCIRENSQSTHIEQNQKQEDVKLGTVTSPPPL